ncbi:Serine/threonine-protein phosphatase 2A regulatory subunit B'' subunit beta, partial [Fragariocoptes setiger]
MTETNRASSSTSQQRRDQVSANATVPLHPTALSTRNLPRAPRTIITPQYINPNNNNNNISSSSSNTIQGINHEQNNKSTSANKISPNDQADKPTQQSSLTSTTVAAQQNTATATSDDRKRATQRTLSSEQLIENKANPSAQASTRANNNSISNINNNCIQPDTQNNNNSNQKIRSELQRARSSSSQSRDHNNKQRESVNERPAAPPNHAASKFKGLNSRTSCESTISNAINNATLNSSHNNVVNNNHESTINRLDVSDCDNELSGAKEVPHNKDAPDRSTKSDISCVNTNNNRNNDNVVVPKTDENMPNDKPAKLHFSIPPPPRAKSNQAVSTARSKIYDKSGNMIAPSSHSNKVSLFDSENGDGILGVIGVARGLVLKPPRQASVNVSKAREKWEGGEPYLMDNIRRARRFLGQQGGHRRSEGSMLGSWSMTSVVATQLKQYQLSLATPSSTNSMSNLSSVGPRNQVVRGSVAERVMQFEKSPPDSPKTLTRSSSSSSIDSTDSNDTESSVTDELIISEPTLKFNNSTSDAKQAIQKSSLTNSEALKKMRRPSLRRQSSSSSEFKIPRFYHPNGKPNTYEIETINRSIIACFDKFPDRRVALTGMNRLRQFHSVALACGLTEYYKEPLYRYVKYYLSTNNISNTIGSPVKALTRRQSVAGAPAATQKIKRPALTKINSLSSEPSPQSESASNHQFVTCDQFIFCWRKVITICVDEVAKFIHLLTMGARRYLLPDDFVPLIQSIIDDHPGLTFLRTAPEFHMRYIQTVVARIYYNVNRSWTGKITLSELRRSNLLSVLARLAREQDINQVTDYFSYEHFYVIYCKFWALDTDHDMLISKQDLARHNDAAISSRIIDRIFMGIGGGPKQQKHIVQTGKMSYPEFVWFLMAEEDKKHPRSVEYWFRLMDLDGDGVISMYEMEYFYYEQSKRLELMGIEALPFQDCACQILDLINPKVPNKISLSDLKRNKLTPIFFDTFINLEKYLDHESREFVSTRDYTHDGVPISDWDRYATMEYEILMSEDTQIEGSNNCVSSASSNARVRSSS